MSNTATHVEDRFLGACLGYPVIRLRAAHGAREAMSQAARHPRWMLETRVPVNDVATARDLQDLGFRLVDTNVQLERAPGEIVVSRLDRCRMAVPADEAAVRAVAANSFSQTRFHLDPRIPRAAADRIKEEWAGNYFKGQRGDWMVVAEDEQGVSGFLQLLRSTNDTIVIDLVAVAERARHRGLARAMIAFAIRHCLATPTKLLVGTQIANVASLALYQGLGFRVSHASYVLHLHGEGSGP